MRILYFVNGLNYKGGIARIVVDKANYLADVLHHEVAICIYEDVPTSAYPISPKVRLIPMGMGNYLDANWWRKFFRVFRNVPRLKAVVKAFHPDVIVNAQTQVLTWALPFVERRIPKVIEIHFSRIGMGYNLRGKPRVLVKLYFAVAQKMYGLYNRFVVLTEEDKRQWNVRHIQVINNFTRFHPSAVSDLTAKRIIYVARYARQKRVDLLIDAWHKLYERFPDWQVNVYGMGDDKQKLQNKVDALGMHHCFVLNDAVNDIERCYLASSIFCSTSEHEGFVLSLLEAMMTGIPICMFNVIGTSWACNGNTTALGCDFGDLDTFTANLAKLMEHPDLRLQIRENALKLLPRYDIAHIMGQWNDLFLALKR